VEVIIIPDCVVEIGEAAFADCQALRILVIGAGVQSIGSNALSAKYNLSAVYFKGTRSAWTNMKGFETINIFGMEISFNEVLKGLPCYYYSEKQTSGSDYWHYVDGVPTLWNKAE
jgi:hypothetical protein